MEEITRILRAQFPGAKICFERDEQTQYINGSVIWAGFRGVSFLERDRLVMNPLRAALGERVNEINMISPYTPKEEKAMHDIDNLVSF